MKKTVTKKDSKKEPKVKKEKKQKVKKEKKQKVKKEKKPKEVVEDRTPTTLEVWDEEVRKTTYKIDFEGHII